MKLHNAPVNEAIMSNVGEIGEFRIRNSAKAFNILSSGLYANKIRAIIRELSCNAVDSHTAAGKTDTPFDVHLPNSFEPYFFIRDYGTGLTHEQVTSIYTTYFESTKTDSNAFIGALGLGSKSPFSYTDNFTVTAVKDGRKGIYTAFINEQGVPSIALMMEEETTDPAGVEVRFGVEERYDFGKFRDEARHVYEYFKLRPVVSGENGFEFRDPSYKERDIIPGVHTVDTYNSYAIMGNIKYPIEVPNADKALGSLNSLLNCGLVLEFDIGELDFQASREGLSYIPQTINAIKAKLQALNAQLAVHIAAEADKIDNLWSRAIYLSTRHNESLWSSAVNKYVADTKFELFDANTNRWNALMTFKISVADLAKKYNMVVRGFSKTRSYETCTTLKATTSSQNGAFFTAWEFKVSDEAHFVINDTKVGATERAKYHWKNSDFNKKSSSVFVIEAADKDKPIQAKKFFKAIQNPPEAQIHKASALMEKDRAKSMGANVSIMYLTEGAQRGYWNTKRNMVWQDAGKADSFETDETYYYLPLSGYTCTGVMSDVKSLHQHLNKSGIFTGTIYGVRKSDIEWVKLQPNWINLDTFIKDQLGQLGMGEVMSVVKSAIGFDTMYQYDAIKKIQNVDSPYVKLYNTFKDVKADDSSRRHSLEVLCRNYQVQSQAVVADPSALISQYTKEAVAIYDRYRLLKHISRYSVDAQDIADYISMVDEQKGV